MSNERKHRGTDDPDFARRLSDGFAFIRACEDDEIDPAEHLGRALDDFLGSDPLDSDDVVENSEEYLDK